MRKSVFDTELLNTIGDAFAVAGERQIADDVHLLGGVVVFAELEAVVADDVDRKAAHLVEDAHDLSRADHQKFVFFRQFFQGVAVLVVQRRLVLREGSVQIECDDFQHGCSFSCLMSITS